MVATVKGEVDQTHYDARGGGVPKHPQTSFAIHEGMKDQNAPSGVTSAVSPIHPGVGPDASMADVLDPYTSAERGRVLRRQPVVLETKWGAKGGDGQSLDPNLGGKVLGEAILSGASKLPAATSEQSGPGVKYPGC